MGPQQLLSWLLSSSKIRSPYLACNGHYNHMPDLGKCGIWWNVWDLARQPILDAKVLDSPCRRLPTRPLGKRMIEDEKENSSD